MTPGACRAGHRGPFAPDAVLTAWMRCITAEAGVEAPSREQGLCLHCGSHVEIPEGAEVVQGAA